jgi:hypothetical protein
VCSVLLIAPALMIRFEHVLIAQAGGKAGDSSAAGQQSGQVRLHSTLCFRPVYPASDLDLFAFDHS